MSTTLTNGLKLPDKGSVDWYTDMQSNYTILDGAVGTVAEHSTQIAGKAPAVHTHTKSNITDFPAYGTTAGTICEGNDSRLSDARTPVAHTHSKADITDLFNSDFIPSANNSYNLGSSSYQWKSVYAQSYYYNGTAWGLDKANTWSANNIFTSNAFVTAYGYRLRIKSDAMKLGTVPSSNQWTGMQFVDKNNSTISEIVQSFQGSGNTFYRINVYPNEANSQSRSVIAYTYNSANNVNTLQVTSDLLPASNNTYDLGISNQKWKTLNGVNPGALSLPSQIGYVTIDTTNWDLTGNTSNPNFYTSTADGWLCVIALAGTMTDVWLDVWVNSLWGQSASQSPSGELFCMIPVRANLSVRIRVKASSIYDARLFIASGNV